MRNNIGVTQTDKQTNGQASVNGTSMLTMSTLARGSPSCGMISISSEKTPEHANDGISSHRSPKMLIIIVNYNKTNAFIVLYRIKGL